jgi:hypothetical protein
MGLEMEKMDDGSIRSSSSAFVEMSTLEKGKIANKDGGGFESIEAGQSWRPQRSVAVMLELQDRSVEAVVRDRLWQ